jgi:hypothetical protein
MSHTVESVVQDEDVEEAVKTEEKLTEDSNEVSMNSFGRENGFYACRVTELRTIEPEEFNDLQSKDFDENHRVLRSGFDFMEDKELGKLERYGLSLPYVEQDIITIKYELVGADEKWEMREFWFANDFPKGRYLMTIPNSRIGNMVGKVVPIIRQPTLRRDGKDRKYVVASLAEENLDRIFTSEASRERSVPHMTVHRYFDMIKFRILTTSTVSLGLIGVAMETLGQSDIGIAVTSLLAITIPFLTLSRSDWFYTRLYDFVRDAQLPSNPYHNQFESVSEFAEETTL